MMHLIELGFVRYDIVCIRSIEHKRLFNGNTSSWREYSQIERERM
jgi:hypothetical protein